PRPVTRSASRSRGRRRGAASLRLIAAIGGIAALAACARPAAGPSSAAAAFLDTLERRTFAWFWDLAEPGTRLTPDRWPTRSFASVGATGFGLTAYPI